MKISSKDRALVAQTAGNIAGGLGSIKDVYLGGRNLNKERLAEDSVELAVMILAVIDKPEPADA